MTTRVAIYARFSSEVQREASIEDQIRVCTAHLSREGWSVVQTYTDYAISGATVLRPGYQALLADARAGCFDIIISESLDRFSRDQEHIAAFFKQVTFAGISIVTLAEGPISELHVGLKGTMSALYLKDLAKKTHRGLEGRVRAGRSAGGLSYGYRVLRDILAGEPDSAGRRVIEETEAAVIRRIYADYAGGLSPRKIARNLNQASVPGPRGGRWTASLLLGAPSARPVSSATGSTLASSYGTVSTSSRIRPPASASLAQTQSQRGLSSLSLNFVLLTRPCGRQFRIGWQRPVGS
jgi:DNA invertase Pin-like site-specific DNA recombinase